MENVIPIYNDQTLFKIMKSCIECPFHKIIPDPDPDDWFCDDDIAVICTLKRKNTDEIDSNSKWLSNRQEFKTVTLSCRPFKNQLEKETKIPDWCPALKEPLIRKKQTEWILQNKSKN